MKIRTVKANNRKRVFEVTTWKGTLPFPYARCEVEPTAEDPIVELFIDDELAREGFTYFLRSGAECSVMLDWVLDVNMDPRFMRDLMLYKLTVQAQKAMKESRLSKREVIRRLGTSPAQFYRLMDQTNYRKSMDKLLELLYVLGCDVDFVLRPKSPQ